VLAQHFARCVDTPILLGGARQFRRSSHDDMRQPDLRPTTAPRAGRRTSRSSASLTRPEIRPRSFVGFLRAQRQELRFPLPRIAGPVTNRPGASASESLAPEGPRA